MGSIINSFADEEFEVKRCLLILIKIMKLHGEFESKPRKFAHLNTAKLHWGLLWWFSSKEIKVKIAQLCPTLREPTDYTIQGILQARTLEWVAFPLLQGIFPAQGSNPSLPQCRWILYQLSHNGSPTGKEGWWLCIDSSNRYLSVTVGRFCRSN